MKSSVIQNCFNLSFESGHRWKQKYKTKDNIPEPQELNPKTKTQTSKQKETNKDKLKPGVRGRSQDLRTADLTKQKSPE